MQILKDIKKEKNTAILLITHDLAVVYQNADEVSVMYAGNIVENAKDYLKIDSVVGVKGTIKTNENKEIQIVADKISFLSSHN